MFGKRIRELRKAKGLSIQKLALETCISVLTIKNYEKNYIKRPNITNIGKLAIALGVDFDELYELAFKIEE